MILELGSSSEFVRVTTEYSNAVLLAILPHISAVGQKLDLPVHHPISAEQVTYCSVLPNRRIEAEISIKGGWVFSFRRGYINTIQGPHEFFLVQDLERIPHYFGKVKMSKDEAIKMARETLHKLDIPLEAVFAEQEPRVAEPPQIGTNTVPHYLIQWLDPRGVGQAPGSVDMDIDAQEKRVERIQLRSKSLERPPPKVSAVPPVDPRVPAWPEVNPDYAWRLLPIVLRAVEAYGQTLSLPIKGPLTTNDVAEFSVADNGGWPHSELRLTNGWRFIYRNSMVNGFYRPDNFFNSEDRAILIKDFLGNWRVSESAARDLVRRSIAKLGYPTNLVHFEIEPQVHKPLLPGIPRYLFYWYYEPSGDLQSIIWAEVDANLDRLTSLYYDEKSFWNHPPPIDLPISRPAMQTTNQPPSEIPTKLPSMQSPRIRFRLPDPKQKLDEAPQIPR
jgi:hypothetical protein